MKKGLAMLCMVLVAACLNAQTDYEGVYEYDELPDDIYGDYDNPYEEPDGIYGDYDNPYEEPDGIYGDYDNPYEEPDGIYGSYGSPYEEPDGIYGERSGSDRDRNAVGSRDALGKKQVDGYLRTLEELVTKAEALADRDDLIGLMGLNCQDLVLKAEPLVRHPALLQDGDRKRLRGLLGRLANALLLLTGDDYGVLLDNF